MSETKNIAWKNLVNKHIKCTNPDTGQIHSDCIITEVFDGLDNRKYLMIEVAGAPQINFKIPLNIALDCIRLLSDDCLAPKKLSD